MISQDNLKQLEVEIERRQTQRYQEYVALLNQYVTSQDVDMDRLAEVALNLSKSARDVKIDADIYANHLRYLDLRDAYQGIHENAEEAKAAIAKLKKQTAEKIAKIESKYSGMRFPTKAEIEQIAKLRAECKVKVEPYNPPIKLAEQQSKILYRHHQSPVTLWERLRIGKKTQAFPASAFLSTGREIAAPVTNKGQAYCVTNTNGVIS